MKFWRQFLCLLLSLALCVPVLALAENDEDNETPAEEKVFRDITPSSLYELDGQLMAVTYDGIYRSAAQVGKDGQEEEGWLLLTGTDGGVDSPLSPESMLGFKTEEAEGSYVTLEHGTLMPDGMLYLLVRCGLASEDNDQYMVFRGKATADGIEAVEKVTDLSFQSSEGDRFFYLEVFDMIADESGVYMLYYEQDNNAPYGVNTLVRIDPETKTVTQLAKDCILSVQPLDEQSLVGVYYDQANSWREDGTRTLPKLCRVSKADGKVTLGCELPDSTTTGLLMADGAVYIRSSSRLLRVASDLSKLETVAFLKPGLDFYGNCARLVYNGEYLFSDYEEEGQGLAHVKISGNELPKQVIRIEQAYELTDILRSYCEEHPEVGIETVEVDAYEAEAISRHMKSDAAADIYAINLNSGAFTVLRDKGYMVELSGDERLMSVVSAMYPNLTGELLRDGHLYALPYAMYASGMGYFPATLEKVGLTKEELPTTYMELLDFIQLWYDEYFYENENVPLLDDTYSLYDLLMGGIFNAQLLACEAQGKPITFNTPTMQALLKRLVALKPVLQAMYPEQEESSSGMIVYGGGDGGTPVLSDYKEAMLNELESDSDWFSVYMPLALDEDTPPYIQTSLDVLVVNPASKARDAACELLAYIAEHLDKETRTLLMPDVNEPIRNDRYEEQLENMNDTIAAMQAEMEKADDADKRSFEESIQEMIRYRDEGLEQWRVTEEMIADYRQRATLLYPTASSVFSGDSNAAEKILQRFMDGQISPEQFIKEFDRIVTMMQMEDY